MQWARRQPIPPFPTQSSQPQTKRSPKLSPAASFGKIVQECTPLEVRDCNNYRAIPRALSRAAERVSSSFRYSFPLEASKPCAERRSARPRSLLPGERGEDPASYTKISRPHMRTFLRAFEAQSNPAEICCFHLEIPSCI